MERIYWFAVKGVVVRLLFGWRRDFDRVVDSFWWASTDVIFWGLTSRYVTRLANGFDVVVLFIGGIIFWTIIQNSQREVNMPLLDDAWNRNLINLFTTPLGLIEFVIATLILGMAKLILVVVFLAMLAWFLYSYNIFVYGFYLLPALINLILVGWTIGFFINGMIFRYGYKIQSFAWAFIFVIYPFSAVLFPVDILPLWARRVSMFLPTSYIFENMRSVLFNGRFDSLEILVAFGLNIFYMLLSIVFMLRMFKSALDHGRLIKLN